MKKIITLLIILAALVGAAVFQQKDRKSRLSSAARKGVDMRQFLLPDLDVNSVQKIRIKDGNSEANIALNGSLWIVAERGGYEASFDKISRALLALKEQKISRKEIVGKTSWGKVGVQPPGEPDAQGIGTLVELLDAKGNIKKSMVLGNNVSSSGNNNTSPLNGNSERLIRIPEDGDTIWVVGNTFSDLESKPESWLDKAFFDVQKAASVEITAEKPDDSWKAARAKESDADFTLVAGAKPGEKLDNSKASLGSILSGPAFNDVLSKDKAATIMKGAVKAKITTFDGFTYDVQSVKQAAKTGSGDKYFLTVSVSANIAKQRAAVKDEKAEDKKKNDEEFAAEKKKKEEKLAAEKKLEGWIFEVSEYTVSTLFKKRGEVLAAPEKKDEPAAGAPSTPAGLPDIKKMVPGLNMPAASSPLTQPSSPLPQSPRVEIKAAPTAGSNPITGEKAAGTTAPKPQGAPEKK